MIKWLAKLLGVNGAPEAVEVEEEQTRDGGFFSTDTPARERKSLSKHIGSLALSFQRSISDMAVAQDAAADAVALDAGVKSTMANITVGVPEEQIAWYASQGFIGYQLCAILSQNWLINKACSMPGEDAVRNGWIFNLDADDTLPIDKIVAHLQKADKKYKIRKAMEEYSRNARIFGIRHAMAIIDSADPDFYLHPFNPDGITPGSYRGITQIDPYWITPELDAAAAADPSSLHFYEPTYWRIGGKRIHRSHIILCIPDEVPDILKPTYMYGGVPLTQQIYERVYAAERCANEGPELLLTKRTTVIHTDMEKAMANQRAFENKLADFAYYRNNFGVKTLGVKEVMEQFDTALADVDAVIMTEYQLVAAIAKVPAVKLMGTSPKGFNATGEHESDSYHEHLESVQTHECEPLLDRHTLCVMRSEIVPRFGIQALDINIGWEPVDAPTGKETAEINLIKAQTGTALVNSGAIDGMDERERIRADVSSGYTGLAEIEYVEPPVEEEPPTPPAEETPDGEETATIVDQ